MDAHTQANMTLTQPLRYECYMQILMLHYQFIVIHNMVLYSALFYDVLSVIDNIELILSAG